MRLCAGPPACNHGSEPFLRGAHRKVWRRFHGVRGRARESRLRTCASSGLGRRVLLQQRMRKSIAMITIVTTITANGIFTIVVNVFVLQ